MSRLSSDTVHVALYPGHAVLARTRGWLLPRVVERGRYAGAPDEALEAALAEPRWQQARLRVVLSNLLVRFVIVPADANLASAADELAVAEARFRQVHGAQVRLEARLSAPLSGRSQVAAGIATDVLDALRARFSQARLRLASMEPLFARAVGRARPPAGGFWLASLEPEALTLACADRAGWASVSVSPTGGDIAAVLGARLREARLLSSARDLPSLLFVHAAGADPSAAPRVVRLDGFEVHMVPPATGVADAALGG